jgi:acyl carrier protein
MPDTRQRLIRCFLAVFPELSESAAVSASVSSMSAWDSVATVTLAAAVEEEFNVQFDIDEIEKLNSFQNYLNRLARS